MKTKFFTLIEVVISLAILSIGITGFLALSISSQKNIAKGYDLWKHMHMASQAAEYYMLMEEDPGVITTQFFDYPGYHVTVNYEDLPEGEVPEDLASLDSQLPLKTLVIELRKDGSEEIVECIKIDRISYESTVQEN